VIMGVAGGWGLGKRSIPSCESDPSPAGLDPQLAVPRWIEPDEPGKNFELIPFGAYGRWDPIPDLP